MTRFALLLAASCGSGAGLAPNNAGSVDASPELPASEPARARCRTELRLDDDACARVAALALPDALPPSAGNRHGDDLEVARLGFLIFYDPRFSSLPEVRCATCHLPEAGFGDAKAVPEVVPGSPLLRNSPSILNAAWSGPAYFWDGRADSLWSQPLLALESPLEMAGSRLQVAHALNAQSIYRGKYEASFGALPALDDAARFPARGRPGEPAYDAMRDADKQAIDLVFANVGKALEAYMRRVATGKSALDRYLEGDATALEPAARAGLAVFAKQGCIGCHGGPTLSDGAYHALVPSDGDPGRAAAPAVLAASTFHARGAYFDADAGARPPPPDAPTARDQGAFRTPTLRNLPRTAPYGHDGRYPTLDALFAAGHGGPLSAEAQAELTVFLMALNGSYPARPWSDWPAR
ncbi:MAG: cytochrome c peroxidase [Polyangiales bacterium]